MQAIAGPPIALPIGQETFLLPVELVVDRSNSCGKSSTKMCFVLQQLVRLYIRFLAGSQIPHIQQVMPPPLKLSDLQAFQPPPEP